MAGSKAGASAVTGPADRELVFTRVFDAPRELVFQAWTDPKHLAQWWGPRGFQTTVHEMEVRPGGVWRLTMHGPDGRDYRNHIVMLEVIRPERLVFKHDPEKGSEPVNHQTTVTFLERGGKTQVTMRMLFSSPDARKHVIRTYEAVEGGNQTLGRLREYLEKSTGRKSSVATPLFMSRVLNAPRERVFEMWKKPEHLARWWGPKNFTLSHCEMDFRTGGAFRFVMRGPDGRDYPFEGDYVEILEPDRIVFRGLIHDKASHEVWTIVTFFEEQSQTKLVVEQAYFFESDATKGAPEGWGQTLDRLEQALAAASPKVAGDSKSVQHNAALKSGHAPVNGLQLYYEIHGTGEPLSCCTAAAQPSRPPSERCLQALRRTAK